MTERGLKDRLRSFFASSLDSGSGVWQSERTLSPSMAPSRAFSPPLPPNATYNHPKLALNILPTAKVFVAGTKLTGSMEVSCSSDKIALGEMALEFLGVEGASTLACRRHGADERARAEVAGAHGPDDGLRSRSHRLPRPVAAAEQRCQGRRTSHRRSLCVCRHGCLRLG